MNELGTAINFDPLGIELRKERPTELMPENYDIELLLPKDEIFSDISNKEEDIINIKKKADEKRRQKIQQ